MHFAWTQRFPLIGGTPPGGPSHFPDDLSAKRKPALGILRCIRRLPMPTKRPPPSPLLSALVALSLWRFRVSNFILKLAMLLLKAKASHFVLKYPVSYLTKLSLRIIDPEMRRLGWP
jgi:hypothetical protein